MLGLGSELPGPCQEHLMQALIELKIWVVPSCPPSSSPLVFFVRACFSLLLMMEMMILLNAKNGNEFPLVVSSQVPTSYSPPTLRNLQDLPTIFNLAPFLTTYSSNQIKGNQLQNYNNALFFKLLYKIFSKNR